MDNQWYSSQWTALVTMFKLLLFSYSIYIYCYAFVVVHAPSYAVDELLLSPDSAQYTNCCLISRVSRPYPSGSGGACSSQKTLMFLWATSLLEPFSLLLGQYMHMSLLHSIQNVNVFNPFCAQRSLKPRCPFQIQQCGQTLVNLTITL